MRGRQAHSLKIPETPATQRLRDSAPRIHPLHVHRHASTHRLRLPGAIGGTGTGRGHGPSRRPRPAGSESCWADGVDTDVINRRFLRQLAAQCDEGGFERRMHPIAQVQSQPGHRGDVKNAALGARQLQPGGQRQQPGAAGVNRVPMEALQCKLYLASRSATPAFARYSSHQIPVQLPGARCLGGWRGHSGASTPFPGLPGIIPSMCSATPPSTVSACPVT